MRCMALAANVTKRPVYSMWRRRGRQWSGLEGRETLQPAKLLSIEMLVAQTLQRRTLVLGGQTLVELQACLCLVVGPHALFPVRRQRTVRLEVSIGSGRTGEQGLGGRQQQAEAGQANDENQ